MSHYYRFAEYSFYPTQNALINQDKRVKIRPKTSELLQRLLDAEGGIVSKDTLLASVWDDVSVDEQVIFQSIKELRKLFGDIDAIKTHPRKGYSWVLTTERLAIDDVANNHSVQPNQQRKFNRSIALVVIAGLVLLASLFWFQKRQNPPIAKGSLLVLPVVNKIQDSDHNWLRFGAMDQLIQRLKSTEDYTVLATEDVMEIMHRANISAVQANASDLQHIFDVSGTSLIVEQTITGTRKNYQLIYTLYSRTTTQRGAFFGEEIWEVTQQLSNKISAQLGMNANAVNHNYQSDFANAMLAAALEKIQQDKVFEAIELLQATITTDQNNLAAHRLLTQLYVTTRQFSDADTLATKALALASAMKNAKEEVRIELWQAISLINQRQWQQGLSLITSTREKALAVGDSLYLAKIAEVNGKVRQAMKDYELAQGQFMLSFNYHRSIQCPYGQSNALMNLGELAAVQGNHTQARDLLQQALVLATERHLPQLQKEITEKLSLLTH